MYNFKLRTACTRCFPPALEIYKKNVGIPLPPITHNSLVCVISETQLLHHSSSHIYLSVKISENQTICTLRLSGSIKISPFKDRFSAFLVDITKLLGEKINIINQPTYLALTSFSSILVASNKRNHTLGIPTCTAGATRNPHAFPSGQEYNHTGIKEPTDRHSIVV